MPQTEHSRGQPRVRQRNRSLEEALARPHAVVKLRNIFVHAHLLPIRDLTLFNELRNHLQHVVRAVRGSHHAFQLLPGLKHPGELLAEGYCVAILTIHWRPGVATKLLIMSRVMRHN